MSAQAKATPIGALKAPANVARRSTRTKPALAAALLVLLEEQAFDQLMIRDITERADISYATFFRHFPDKEALLHEVAAREIRKLLGMTLPILYGIDSRSSTRALCAYVWEHRKLWSALLTGGAAATLKEEYVREAQRRAAAEQVYKSWLPGDLNVVFSVTACVEIMTWWLRQTDPPSIEEMAVIVDELVVIPSISARKGALPRGRRTRKS